jgi:3-hydroxyisobutyrate dehydrogenase-like beta-hydroxyacid dehydrogenase
VALGEKGVIQGKAIKVLIETSTIGSQQMEKLAGPLFDRGIGLLDAPISGGSDAATKGELTAIIAGPTAILNETRQLWNDLSTTLFHVSEKQGTAQLFKLLNNYVMRCSMIASCEAMAAGVAAGADEAQLLDVLNHCTAANFTTRVLFPSSVIPGAAMAPLTMALSEVRAFHAEVEKYGIQSELSVGAINVLTKASSESKNLSDWYRKLKVGA